MAQAKLSTTVTPNTKTLYIGITAIHFIKTFNFNDPSDCALAKAVREQLNVTGVLVDTYEVDFDSDGDTSVWRIVGRYQLSDYIADRKQALLADNPQTVIRRIQLKRI